jgi:molybdenum cofactor biosynthesis protein MoaC/molybdopterin converting factor subunit 1
VNGELRIEVKLFAILRERAGTAAVALVLEPGATVADALRALAQHDGLREPLESMAVAMAVNREYARRETPLQPGDELALIPPLSGGGSELDSPSAASLVDGPLSAERVRALVGDPRAGAIVVFEGVTRDVELLDYEAYTPMATERIAQILDAATAGHGAIAAAAEHRVGEVPLGEPSVIVAVSARHRGEAFAAAREAIDRIKSEAPIWKRELQGGVARWVEGAPPPLHPAAEGAPPPLDSRAPADIPPAPAEPAQLTHVSPDGSARMVDVTDKQPSARVARARARVRMSHATAGAVAAGDGPKGEVLGVARIAGIQAAKQTGNLIPLAHPLALDLVDVAATVDVQTGSVELTSEVRTYGRTGVEMEAMTACAVAALTVYDMVKGLERGVTIEQVVLLEKRGGRSDYRLEDRLQA